MYDVTALGELLIDFTPAGKSASDNQLFERNPGGAPANVLVALSRLGKKTAFIGKVGRDQFGHFLKETINNLNIETSGLVLDAQVNTTLAFIHLDSHGDRSFSFYRNPGADIMLNEKEINFDLIKHSKIFHFGSVSMTAEPARTANLKAAEYARQSKVLVSYDPNFRRPLWNNLETAKEVMLQGLALADILKVSEEELEFLTGTSDITDGSKLLQQYGNTQLIFVTLGINGCFFRLGDQTGLVPTYSVSTVDTTGAGDAFWGGVLYKITERKNLLLDLTTNELNEIADFGNAMGAVTTTKKGAIPAIPDLKQIRQFMNSK